jgi:hypothetical protein
MDIRTQTEMLEMRNRAARICQRGSLQPLLPASTYHPGGSDWQTFVAELTKAAMGVA